MKEANTDTLIIQSGTYCYPANSHPFYDLRRCRPFLTPFEILPNIPNIIDINHDFPQLQQTNEDNQIAFPSKL